MRFDFSHHFSSTSSLKGDDTPNSRNSELNLWVPYPVSDRHQRVSNMRIETDAESSGVYTERVFRNTMLYARWSEEKPSTASGVEREPSLERDGDKEKLKRRFYLTMTFDVERSRITQYQLHSSSPTLLPPFPFPLSAFIFPY